MIVLVWFFWIICVIPFDYFQSANYDLSEPVVLKESYLVSIPSSSAESGELDSSFIQPAVGVITSSFGERWGRNHEGIDIGGEYASDIKAAKGGNVLVAGWVDGYGNYIELDHGNGLKTAYGHCDELLVTKGDVVSPGQVIAKMGSTGNSTGTHLHFEVILNGEPQNPLNYVIY